MRPTGHVFEWDPRVFKTQKLLSMLSKLPHPKAGTSLMSPISVAPVFNPVRFRTVTPSILTVSMPTVALRLIYIWIWYQVPFTIRPEAEFPKVVFMAEALEIEQITAPAAVRI
jgi:hypothetical protein